MEIKLTQKSLILVVAAAVAVAMLLMYFIFYAPLIKKLKVSYREYKLCETEVLDARNIIETVGKAQEGKCLITEGGVSLAIDELTKYGKSMGINFISIKPREIMADKGAQYKMLPIEMEIEADNEQFFEFLGSLDEVKNSLIRVRSFNLMPDKDDRAKLDAKITVDVCLSSEI